MIASTVLVALCFMSCASSRNQTVTNRETSLAASMDSAGKYRHGLLMTGIPPSELTLKIPVPDLKALPPGASYRKKSGQAGVDVRADGDTLVVTSTCDSLQRLVLWYEEELTRIRNETSREKETAQTEQKRRFNPVKTAFYAFVAGLLSGIVLTFLKRKRK